MLITGQMSYLSGTLCLTLTEKSLTRHVPVATHTHTHTHLYLHKISSSFSPVLVLKRGSSPQVFRSNPQGLAGGFVPSDVIKLGRYKEVGRGKDVRAQMREASGDQRAQTGSRRRHAAHTFTQREKLLQSADKPSKSSLKSTLHTAQSFHRALRASFIKRTSTRYALPDPL